MVIVNKNEKGSYDPSSSALNDGYFGPYTMAWNVSEPKYDANDNPWWENGDYAIWWYNEKWNIGEKSNEKGVKVPSPAKPTLPVIPIILTGSSLEWGNIRTLADTPCPYTTRDQVSWKYKNLAGEWIGDASEIVTTAGTLIQFEV